MKSFIGHWLNVGCTAILIAQFLQLPAQAQIRETVEWALDDQSMAVAWMNPITVDLDAFLKLGNRVGLEIDENVSQVAQNFIQSMKAKGATRVAVVVDFSSLMGQMPMVVVSTNNTAGVEALLTSIKPPDEWVSVTTMRNTVVLASKDRLQRLSSSSTSKVNEKLLKMLSESQGDHGAVIAIPSVPRQMFVSMLKSQPDAVAFNSREILATLVKLVGNIEAVRVNYFEQGTRLETLTELDSEQSASEFGKIARGLVPNSDSLTRDLLPIVKERTLVWNVQGIDSLGTLLDSMPLIRQARADAQQMRDMNSMKQIGLAFHNFESAYRSFVPQSLASKDGKKLLSWRVLILPFLEEPDLFQQFKLDEPWDSPHNKKLIEKMPKLYATRGAPPGMTAFQVPLAPRSAFGRPGKPLQFQDITDGTSNSIWLVETDAENAVPWTKPEDYTITEEAAYVKLFTGREKMPVGFIDGSVRMIGKEIPYSTFEQLLTIDGGEVVQLP
jgi:hypothetical protein